MKKNLLILVAIILMVIPLKVNSFSEDYLKDICKPLIWLNDNHTQYQCKELATDSNPFGIFDLTVNVHLTGLDAPNAQSDEANLDSYKDSNTCSNTGECFRGVGLMFQLIYYNGEGEPVTVGNKYHVYNPSLLTDQTIANKVPLPQTPYDFRDPNQDFHLTQQLSPGDESGQIHTRPSEEGWYEVYEPHIIHQDGQAYTDENGVPHDAQPPNRYLGTSDYDVDEHTDHDGKDMYSYQQDFSEQTNYSAHDNIVHIYSDWTYGKTSGWTIYILKYMSNYSKTTYPKTKILSPGWSEGQPLKALDFSGWEEDSTLTEEEVGSNYLKNKVSKYFARETVAETVKAVNSKFGTNISERDLQYYYIEVQAIYRVYTDKKEKVGSFLVKQIPEVVQDPVKVNRSFFKESSSTTANEPYLCRYHDKTWLERGKCREEENTCNKKADADKDLTCSFDKNGSCTASDGSDSCFWMRFDAEPLYGGCGKCDGNNKYVKEEVPYFFFIGAPNGKKVLHKVLGTAYEGWSQLVYTKSPTDETCDTDKITTSLGDVMTQNKHCELYEFSSEYSEQEKANQCDSQNKYHYYIGPDEKRGLVGTKSTNPYNLFGSNGNKCRSGVKHYYLLDLEATGKNTPPKCQQVCANAGSKDSNTYLQCAEDYCDHDIDYSLGGQPFVRKRDCLLNVLSCDYQYGREPTMGSSSGKERQSVSSCANTKLFKTGSGTSYTLEKTPVNASSSCGTNLSSLTGKDSICIGDTVTDYNGTDAGETSFDTRTYINIACQEEESITSIGGMNDPVKAGLPISYSIKTKGKVTCVAFFNYEQWKVDYAIVPSQDIIRRKRLDYIYQKYNNLMTNGYTVDSSLTSFDAYDLDGKTMQHWTITDADGLGQIKWDNYIININNSSAKAESKETLKNDTTKKQEENPLTDFTKDIATLSVVPSEMDLTSGVYKAYNTGNSANGGGISNDKKLIKIANNSITTPGTGSNGNSILMGYVQTSTDTKSYVYAKYCVDREGKVYKAENSGVCSDGKVGNNAFYTDLNDVASLNNNPDIHNIKGTVEVTTSLPTSDLDIYKDEDTCPINITGDKDGSAYCKFKIISGDSIGDKTFLNSSGVEVMIEFYDEKGIKIKPDSFTVTMTSPYRNETSTNKYNTLKLKNSALASGLEDIKLNGTFTYSGHTTQDCPEQLTIIQKGNMCDIEKIENKDKEYNVNTNVSNPAVVMGGMTNQRITQEYNGNHYPTNLGRLGRPTHEGELYKYLLDLKKSKFDDQSVVVGYVNNGSTGEFCYRPEGTIKQCVKNETTGNGLYLPGQYEEITKYCGENWAKDTYGYDSYADCVDTCARCPTHENEVIGWEGNAQDTQDNIKKVNDFCDAYATYGYSSKDVCVSLVYERCINPGEYKYRPVNASNPFPSAVDNASIAPGYNTGDRIIGSNWKGKEHYITEGNPTTPRYQIALTADRIRQIRSEISGDNKTSVYTKLNPVNDSKEGNSYMSKYIRTTYYDMFCIIQGVRTTSTTGGCEIKQ